jgi:hypothetical protein
LRYYLDFCHKYHFEPLTRQNISCFLNKLEEKIRMNNKRSKPFMQYQFFIGFAGENLRDVHL